MRRRKKGFESEGKSFITQAHADLMFNILATALGGGPKRVASIWLDLQDEQGQKYGAIFAVHYPYLNPNRDSSISALIKDLRSAALEKVSQTQNIDLGF
jgi:hypothetical protein